MTNNWVEATRKYRDAGAAEQAKERERRVATQIGAGESEEAKKRRERDADFATATALLEQFMESEGPAAMELLSASKKEIRLGEFKDAGAHSFYWMDATGLHEEVGTPGWEAIYNKDSPRPRTLPLSSSSAVVAIVSHAKVEPLDAVDWLRRQLDAIAKCAPEI